MVLFQYIARMCMLCVVRALECKTDPLRVNSDIFLRTVPDMALCTALRHLDLRFAAYLHLSSLILSSSFVSESWPPCRRPLPSTRSSLLVEVMLTLRPPIPSPHPFLSASFPSLHMSTRRLFSNNRISTRPDVSKCLALSTFEWHGNHR
jgi:hypothetical protein